MSWSIKKIGDFLTESAVLSESPSAERRIRVKLNAEGVEKRPLLSETKGATRYFCRSAGQFIYGKQNLHKGAFGIVSDDLDGFESSSDLPAFDVAEGLRPQWLEYFLKQGNFYKSLISIARGAATKRIPPETLFQIEMPIPSLEVQDKIISKMNISVTEHAKLVHEIAHQQKLLGKLKQAILQEAIQGKRTEQWRTANPDTEPAAELLKRVQKEKEQLIADKKIRKQKPLPPITPEETAFDIPEGWEWCRLGDLTEFVTSGSRGWKTFYAPHGSLFIRAQNIKTDQLDLTQTAFVKLPDRMEGQRTKVQLDDILVTITGGNCGKTARVDQKLNEAYVSQHIALTRMMEPRLSIWAHLCLTTDSGPRGVLLSYSKGDKPGLNLPNVRTVPIPLPPLAEQAAIVERVEALMEHCRELEKEIDRSRRHADHLLQAVLKEAFSPAKIETVEGRNV
jgi:type I restriction enzyme S subunit